MGKRTLTLELSEVLMATPSEDLPPQAMERAAQCLLDGVGVAAFGGRFVDSSSVIRAAAGRLAGGQVSGGTAVIGEVQGLPPQYAALVNGAYLHAMDFDDTHLAGRVHPGACVVPAALAVGEAWGTDGPTLLSAIVVGHEATCRIGAALGESAYDRGFHITGLAGAFGAATAIGRIKGMSGAQLATVWGIVASLAAGSQQYLANGAWTKRLHPGWAAHSAFVATVLADAGMTGAEQPLEGEYGFLRAHSDAVDVGSLTDELGVVWQMTDTAFKPWPSCRFAHGAIEASLQVRESLAASGGDGLVASASSVDVTVSERSLVLLGQGLPHQRRPHNLVDAQFSLFAQVALALRFGSPTWESYTKLDEPSVQRLCDVITVRSDTGMPAAGGAISVTVAGTQHEARVEEPLGEPSRPVGWDGVVEKFTHHAEAVFGTGPTHELVAGARAMAATSDLRRWFALLRGPAVLAEQAS
jgi:2-methylcitrate dehydratase PrpD